MKIFIALSLLFYSVFTHSQEQSFPAEVLNSIENRIQAGMNPSIVIGIIDKNGPRYYSYGKKKEGGKNVNEHSIYEIGSISKVFTGILLADMSLKGELNLNDPIEKFLPSYVETPTYEGEHITLGNLSDHTSSLPRLPGNFAPADPGNPYADYSVEQMYAFLSTYELKRPIGSEYEYSNFAVGLLGHILSLKAGKPYEDLVVSTIAAPISMNETRIMLTKAMKKNLATGHNQEEPVANWDLPTLAGAGGIRSSISDMLKFIGANLGLNDHPAKKAMMLSHTARHDKGGDNKVGLGWHIQQGQDGDIIWHNGGTGGYSSFAGFVKEQGLGVVVMTNSTEGVDDIGFHLLDASSPLRNVVPHIAIELKKLVDQEGVENLMSLYDKIKKASPAKYDYGEMGINSLGYYYLNRKKFDAALAVFLLNIREFPESFNVYDSYAEGLMEMGEKDQAILNYKKSLELNPGNSNAVEMLSKMGVVIEIKDPVIDEAILSLYPGTYELSPGFQIVITKESNQLYGQATGQSAFPLFPKSTNEFYLKVVVAQIVFNSDSSGKIESLTLHQNGAEIVGKKTK